MCISNLNTLKLEQNVYVSKFDSHENCLRNKTLCAVDVRHHVFRPAHERKHCCCLYANAQIHIHTCTPRILVSLRNASLASEKYVCSRSLRNQYERGCMYG
jgi:hypothetical protein